MLGGLLTLGRGPVGVTVAGLQGRIWASGAGWPAHSGAGSSQQGARLVVKQGMQQRLPRSDMAMGTTWRRTGPAAMEGSYKAMA